MDTIEKDSNPLHLASVEGPNGAPTGARYNTFTGNYAVGFPNVPDPQWMKDEVERFRLEKLAAAGSVVVSTADSSDLLT